MTGLILFLHLDKMLRRGGSVASTGVLSAVHDGAFDGMNARFTNLVGGCGNSKCPKCGGSLTLASVMQRDNQGGSYRLHNQKGGSSPFALVKPESQYAGGEKSKKTKGKPKTKQIKKGGAAGNLVGYNIPTTSTNGYVHGPGAGADVASHIWATEQLHASPQRTKSVASGGVMNNMDVQNFGYSTSSLTYAPATGGAKKGAKKPSKKKPTAAKKPSKKKRIVTKK